MDNTKYAWLLEGIETAKTLSLPAMWAWKKKTLGCIASAIAQPFKKIGRASDWLRAGILGSYGKAVGFCASLRLCLRNPGLSEWAAAFALGLSLVGGIASIWHKRLRKFAPLFAALAALGTATILLRCFFPRKRR